MLDTVAAHQKIYCTRRNVLKNISQKLETLKQKNNQRFDAKKRNPPNAWRRLQSEDGNVRKRWKRVQRQNVALSRVKMVRDSTGAVQQRCCTACCTAACPACSSPCSATSAMQSDGKADPSNPHSTKWPRYPWYTKLNKLRVEESFSDQSMIWRVELLWMERLMNWVSCADSRRWHHACHRVR